MRRSRSHLKNLTAQTAHGIPAAAGGHPSHGASQYADEIQRRIDAIGANYPAHFDPPNPYPAYQPMHMPNPAGHAPYASPHPANIHPVMYADQPSTIPAYHAAPVDGTMEQVKTALMQMSSQLQAMGNQSNQSQKTLQIESVLAEHVNSIAAELVDLKAVVAAALEKQPAAKEIANIKQAIDTVGNEIRENNQNDDGIDPNAYALAVEASHEKLARQINEIQNALVSAESKPDSYAKTLETSHEALRSQIESLHQAYSVGRQEQISKDQASESQYQQIVEKLDQLGGKIRNGAGSSGVAGDFDSTPIEARLEEINRAIIALSHNSGGVDQLERLEARISDLSKSFENQSRGDFNDKSEPIMQVLEALQNRVENLGILSGEGGGVDNAALISRLDQLVDRVAELNATSSDDEPIQQLSSQIANIESRFKTFQPSTLNSDFGATQDIISRLEDLSGAINSSLGNSGLESFESNISELGGKITSIEEQLASSRDISIELATQVAEEAVQKVISQLDTTQNSNINPDLLRTLSADIQRLHESISEANSETANTFLSMRQTIDDLVERVDGFEESSGEPVSSVAQNIQQAEQIGSPVNQVPETNDPVQEHFETVPVEKPESNNRIAEYRALVNAPDEEDKPSVAHSLLAEASRAEKLRQESHNATTEASIAVPEVVDEPDIDQFAQLPEHSAPSVAPETALEHDLEFDETPIEPGSGGPDLAALVKQANDRRKSLAKSGEGSSGTDFIAAARRAAQAAAQEASAAHDVNSEQDQDSKGSILDNIPGLFSRRKKVVTMVAAGTLVAALAVPLAGKFLSPVSNEYVASIVPADTSNASAPLSQNDNSQITDQNSTSGVEEELPSNELIVEVPESTDLMQEANTVIEEPDFSGEISFGNSALKSAVANGDGAALHEVARRYTEGLGTEKDLEQAAIWYERAANQDYAPAQYMVANFREKGVGIERDLSIAASWYERAADNGNVVSMHNLAVLYATPNAISPEPNMNAAFEWFKKAAEHGVRDSQVNLGIFYTKGVGTEVDLPAAYKWFTIAAKAGDSDAESKRDVIAEALRPDQLEDAKTRIETWRPAEYVIAANRAEPAAEWLDENTPSPLALNKETIAKTQSLLARIGYDAGPADGIMGAKTKDAIAQFQQRVGLEINGQISSELLRELEAIAI